MTTINKPFTHERCDCGWQDKIRVHASRLCPTCGKTTYLIRTLMTPLLSDDRAKGKKDASKVSGGKHQQVFTLPKKLVGSDDPSDAFLGIVKETPVTKESKNESN